MILILGRIFSQGIRDIPWLNVFAPNVPQFRGSSLLYSINSSSMIKQCLQPMILYEAVIKSQELQKVTEARDF